jgi:hypothetical protein
MYEKKKSTAALKNQTKDHLIESFKENQNIENLSNPTYLSDNIVYHDDIMNKTIKEKVNIFNKNEKPIKLKKDELPSKKFKKIIDPHTGKSKWVEDESGNEMTSENNWYNTDDFMANSIDDK